ncbi:MAG: hypothetical protein OIF38_11965 [Cellvibrionaceae bacterium]|nr:hypothetical protein [Cellvibrionaceae bacterium]
MSEYPPYLSATAADYGTGYYIFKNYACKNFKAELEPLFLPQKRVSRLVKQGEWCLSLMPPPNDQYRFVPVAPEPVKLGLLFNRHSPPATNTLAELKGKQVAILYSGMPTPLYKKLRDMGADLIAIESTQQMYKMLTANRVDYVFSDNKSHKDLGYEEQLQMLEPALFDIPVGFFYKPSCAKKIFTPGHPELEIDSD